MAVAALQRGPILQQSLSWGPGITAVKQSLRGSSRSVLGSKLPSASLFSLSMRRVCTRGRIPSGSGSWRAKVEEEGPDGVQESVTPGESNLGEAKGFGTSSRAVVTEKKRFSKSSSSSPSGSIRRSPPSKPLIGVQAADGKTQQIETAVVASLAFLLALILLEGLMLAFSGFLPEEWDQFAVNSVYPAFTPTVGVFLATAAGYGLWKYLGGGTGTSSS